MSPRSYSDLSSLVSVKLADTALSYVSATAINYQLEETLKEIVPYSTRILPIIYKLESRTGNDLTGTASTLTDTVEAQFLSTDPTLEKVVHNLTDNTWAVVTGYTSTSVLGLSADIMAANESYAIYNKHCTNNKQIYIGDFYEYTDIDSVEYPLGTRRNYTIKGDVLEVDIDYVPDSDTTNTYLPNVDVLVRFVKPHILSQLTDSVGTVKTAAVAGAVTLAGSSLQTSGTIEPGEEFYIATHRNPYIVITSATIAANTVAMSIYPPLESAAASALVITFKQSTLTPMLESAVTDYTTGKLAVEESMSLYQQSQASTTTIASADAAIAAMTAMISSATVQIAAGSVQVAAMSTLIAAATVRFDAMTSMISAATASITSSSALINTVTLGSGAPEWLSKANTEINVAQGDFSSGIMELRIAQTKGENNSAHLQNASVNLSAASSKLAQASAYLKEAYNKCAYLGEAGKKLESWGRNKMSDAILQLRRMAKPKTNRRYTRD